MGAFITKQNKVTFDRKMMAGIEKRLDGPILLDGALRYGGPI
jgi:hypothetical protein